MMLTLFSVILTYHLAYFFSFFVYLVQG